MSRRRQWSQLGIKTGKRIEQHREQGKHKEQERRIMRIPKTDWKNILLNFRSVYVYDVYLSSWLTSLSMTGSVYTPSIVVLKWDTDSHFFSFCICLRFISLKSVPSVWKILFQRLFRSSFYPLSILFLSCHTSCLLEPHKSKGVYHSFISYAKGKTWLCLSDVFFDTRGQGRYVWTWTTTNALGIDIYRRRWSLNFFSSLHENVLHSSLSLCSITLLFYTRTWFCLPFIFLFFLPFFSCLCLSPASFTQTSFTFLSLLLFPRRRVFPW